MDDIVLTRVMRAQGYDFDEIRRLQQRGELTRLRRGAYVRGGQGDLSVEQRHRQLIEATVPLLHDGAVISHSSAAVLHRLPVWSSAASQVHLTRDRLGGGKNRARVRVHGVRLAHRDVTVIDGVAVTTLSRTVLDLCRTLPLEQAVAAGDCALGYGLSIELLADSLLQLGRSAGATGHRADGLAQREPRRVGEPGADHHRRRAGP